MTCRAGPQDVTRKGEVRQSALRMKSIEASDTLVQQLTSASTSLELQYNELSSVVLQKVNCAETYDPFMSQATKNLEYYDDRKVYANALASCKKRQTKASAAVAGNEGTDA